MDEAEQPESLFNIGDGPEGWVTVRRFLMALERSGVTSLRERPVHIGTKAGRTLGPSPEVGGTWPKHDERLTLPEY